MITKLISFLSLLIISSCANFINQIDDDLLTQKSIPYKKITNKITYCKKEPNFTLISESKDSQKVFSKFIKDYKFNYADKVALWTFVQMNLRPDLSGPNSNLQIFLKYNGRQDYYHFFSKEKKVSYPLFFGFPCPELLSLRCSRLRRLGGSSLPCVLK